MAKKTHEEISREIIAALDVRAEYAALGLEIIGTESNGKGFVTCRAIGRDDRNPSAAINLKTGRYYDLGPAASGNNLSLFDFAAAHGPFADWQAARRHYASKAGVKLGRVSAPPRPDEKIEFTPFVESLAALWCRHKPGVTVEALVANGARLGQYRRQYPVVALPVFATTQTAADPCGWILWHRAGLELPIFNRGPGSPPTWKKMKSTRGSQPGLVGADALVKLADVGSDGEPKKSLIIWKVEGPSDLLALWSAIPPAERDRHVVLTNAHGAGEHPRDDWITLLLGHEVRVVHDADEAGESGARKWCEAIARRGGTARHVRLPYPVKESHGKDLRDWLAERHSFADLCGLAEQCPTEPIPDDTGSDGLEPIEAADDPHRLARVYLDRYASDARRRKQLRYWREEWYLHDGRAYRLLSTSELRARITSAVKQELDRCHLESMAESTDKDKPQKVMKVTRALVSNVIGALEGMCTVPGWQQQNTWLSGGGDGSEDSSTLSTDCLILSNGILDMQRLLADREDCLIEHTPEWWSSIALPYAFDPEADCLRFKAVMQKNMEGDQERIRLLRQWAGYLLLPTTDEQKFLILEGDGSNGKSVYCAAIEAMLGMDNVSHVPLERFVERFALGDTLGKLANIAAEVGELDRVGEGYLKSFTSGDRMSFDRKGLPAISAAPTARLMLAANTRPRFADRSSGLWRRMILCPWRVEILQHEKIKGMDKPEWWQKSGELPGILVWAIQGLADLRTTGEFVEPKICREAIRDYQTQNNPAKIFLEEHCEFSGEGNLKVLDLYKKYSAWCKENGYKALSSSHFGIEVKRMFPQSERRRLSQHNERLYVYEGLKMIGEEEEKWV